MEAGEIFLSSFRVECDLLDLLDLPTLSDRRHIPLREVVVLFANILNFSKVEGRKTEFAETAETNLPSICCSHCDRANTFPSITHTTMLLPRLGALLLAASYAHAFKNTSPFFLLSSEPFVHHTPGSRRSANLFTVFHPTHPCRAHRSP